MKTPISNLLRIVAVSVLLSACGDSGVYVGNENQVVPNTTGNGASTATGGTAGTTTNSTTGTSDSGTSAGSTTGNNTTAGSTTGSSTDSGSTTGNATPVVPPTNASANLDPNDIEAARFLNQATFGATEKTIEQFRTYSSASAWIDAQLALPVSLTAPYTRANSNGSSGEARHEAWWNNVLDEPDQLRQRVAFALSQIFVVSDLDYALSNGQYGMSDYYDMLSRNAFGNFRTLLEDVTLHPVMGVYLSMVRNEKANPELKIRPDENYAREVLQLFSIGLFELNMRGEAVPRGEPKPSYTQKTVEEFARVFTGWEYPTTRYWGDTNVTSDFYVGRMVTNENYHDFGSKQLLNGTIVPAGLSTEQDMQAALNNIFQHKNVAPFISKQLIQRLVTSNPSPGYVERVANRFENNGAGVRGDLAAVVRAILLDDEARNGHLGNPGFGKIREPNIKLAHYWRALSATPGPLANGVHNTPDFTLQRLDEMGGQAVMRSKSVFNFYLPGYRLAPGSSLLAPEMQNMSEAFIASTHNNYHHLVYRFNNRSDLSDDNPRVTVTNLDPLADMASSPNRLMDWYNLIFFGGSMPDSLRNSLVTYMASIPNNGDGRFARAQDSLFMLMVSPQSNIQR